MESTLIPDMVAVLFTAGVAAWVCQKIRISPIIGYLLTGILVGPFTKPQMVANIESIHTLANLGLIFVMFFIGLELSLKRLKTLGLAPLLVSVLTALLIFNGVRLGGGLFGFDGVQSLFVAGTIMISSSVIVNRVMGEMNLSREGFARTAIGVTLLEDAVAVSMLAILGSIGVSGDAGGGGQPNVIPLIGRLAGFVMLAIVAALIFVPKLLDRVSRMSNEATTVITAGILLLVAYLASKAGYSLALGAFLIGSVIGGTRHKARFLQSFEGMHDVFAAVFFVSMGMLFDVGLFAQSMPLAIGLSLCAILGRTAAALVAFMVAGKPLGFSVKAAACLVPLGEFSFVIAQLGVQSGRMSRTFFPACVGAVLLTTILAPWVTRLGIRLGDSVGRHEPAFLVSWRNFLSRVSEGGGGTGLLARCRGSGLWGRLVQFGLGTALVLSVLAFSSSISNWLKEPLQGVFVSAADWLAGNFGIAIGADGLFGVAFWSALVLLLFAPCFALWRGLRAMARISAEVVLGRKVTAGLSAPQRIFAQTVELAVLVTGSLLFFLMVGAALPSSMPIHGKSAVVLLLAGLIALLIRSRLSRLQDKVQADIIAEVEGPSMSEVPSSASTPQGVLEAAGASLASEDWKLHVREISLGSDCRPIGMTLAQTGLRKRFGCSVAAIDRQGIVISNPSADTRLFPEDSLLLVGTSDQLKDAATWLLARPEGDLQGKSDGPSFSELVTESVITPMSFSKAGATLAELGVASRFRVTVLGLERDGEVIQNPAGNQTIQGGDRLLFLGFPGQNREFLRWLGAASMVPRCTGEMPSVAPTAVQTSASVAGETASATVQATPEATSEK